MKRCSRFALGLAAAVLATLQAVASRAQDDLSPTSVPVDDDVVLNGLATMPPSLTEAFLGRPLFAPTRRPPPEALPEPEPEPEPVPIGDAEPIPQAAPEMQLFGTLEMAEGIVAMMRNPATGESMVARVGDDLSGWIVTAITPTGISLESDGAVLDLEMFQPGPSQADGGDESLGFDEPPADDMGGGMGPPPDREPPPGEPGETRMEPHILGGEGDSDF